MPLSNPAVAMPYPSVQTFADLPTVADHFGDIYTVLEASGVMFVNRKRAGLYRSNGVVWKRLGEIIVAAAENPISGYLISNPPAGKFIIANIYRNEAGNIEYEFENIPKS